MSFIAVFHQGGGCDTTIECGTEVLDLQVDSWVEAIAKAQSLAQEYSDLETATVYEIVALSNLNLTRE